MRGGTNLEATLWGRIRTRLENIDMTQGPPWKNLTLFTIPLLVGNVFQQMYATADAIMLGHYVGDHALAAVGATVGMFFLVIVLMMGIGMGAGIMVSQYFGAKRREELSYTIGTALVLTTILGIIMMTTLPWLTTPVLRLLDTPESIIPDAALYMNVLLIGVLSLGYFNVLSGILRGLGDSFSSIKYLAIACVLNVVLNFILIGMMGFGVWGAALGTVAAQGVSSVLCFRRLLQMQDTFDIAPKYFALRKTYVSQLLWLGLPTGLSQAIFAIGFMIVQPLINGFGYIFIAVNVIVMRIDGIVMMPNFSFGNAMTVYSGQNMGAGTLDRISRGFWQCAALSVGTAAVLIAVILAFGGAIAGAFTQTAEVVDMTRRMLVILAPGYAIMALNMVIWGQIRGAGDAITPLWASIINTALIRVPSAILLVRLLSTPEALFYSMLLAWGTNCVLGIIALRLGRWRKTGLVKQGAGG